MSNLTGVLGCVQAEIAQMVRKSGGIVISSICAGRPTAYNAAGYRTDQISSVGPDNSVDGFARQVRLQVWLLLPTLAALGCGCGRQNRVE